MTPGPHQCRLRIGPHLTDLIDRGGSPRVWHVVFCTARLDHWILNRLEFGHVYAMRRSIGGNFWVVIDPTTSCIDATIISVESCPTPADYKETSLKTVRVVVKPKEIRKFSVGIDVFSCVSVVKHLLGITKRRIFTPKQLCNYLESQNG